MHCTVHMTVPCRGMAVQCGSVGTCNLSVSREWDGHGWLVGRSVGRSVDARGPVDHASVGLAQARPNHFPVHSMDNDIAKEARVPYCSC